MIYYTIKTNLTNSTNILENHNKEILEYDYYLTKENINVKLIKNLISKIFLNFNLNI